MNNLAGVAIVAPTLLARNLLLEAAVSLFFAILGRIVRGVNTSGAIAGALVCFALTVGAGWGAFAALCMVFVLTWAATRVGYRRKQSLGRAESRKGRNALQVLANIGIAAVCALLYLRFHSPGFLVAVGAALTEATADTVSSEIGQARGRTPWLITNLQPVAIGTDGGITLAGTVAGCTAGLIVSAVCAATGTLTWRGAVTCFVAGVLGMSFDSLLGATLERKGWLNNNGVNFFSTLFAAALAFAIVYRF